MFCYCAESRRLARLLTARYDSALAPAGLSAAQFEVLSTLRERKLVNGRALAEMLVVDPTTLSRNLKALVSGRLVAAQKSTADARLTEYSLTALGLKRHALAMPLWQQAHADTRTSVGAAGMQQALQSMTTRLRAAPVR